MASKRAEDLRAIAEEFDLGIQLEYPDRPNIDPVRTAEQALRYDDVATMWDTPISGWAEAVARPRSTDPRSAERLKAFGGKMIACVQTCARWWKGPQVTVYGIITPGMVLVTTTLTEQTPPNNEHISVY